MSNRIYFPLTEVAALAEACVAAPDHTDSWLDAEDGRRTGPALMWVKDDGTYLMDNGLRPEGQMPTVIYGSATPDGPRLDGTQYDLVADICGGDDFAEYVEITPTWLAAVRDALRDGYRFLRINVTDGAFTVTVDGAPRRQAPSTRKMPRAATAADLKDGDLVSFAGRVVNLTRSASGKMIDYDVEHFHVGTGAVVSTTHYHQRATTAVYIYEEVAA